MANFDGKFFCPCFSRASARGTPSTVRNFMTSSGCSMRGALPKKERVPTVLGGSTILKLIWGGNLLYFQGFGDLQQYETWNFRICSESVPMVFPDLFRISLRNCLTVLGAPPIQAPQKVHAQNLPVVQMALQTEKNYFRIIYAFHSRCRYRRKLFWN